MYKMINNMVYTGRPQADWKWGGWGGVAPLMSANPEGHIGRPGPSGNGGVGGAQTPQQRANA